MTEFSFNRAALDGLSDADKEAALAAADTAEILAGYYQNVARSIVDRTGGNIRPPSFTSAQLSLARDAQMVMAGVPPRTTAGGAAAKIFLAAQMDFYRQNPKYVAAFVGQPDDLLAAVEAMRDVLPETWGPVDEYFENAFQEARKFAATPANQPPPGPAPGGP